MDFESLNLIAFPVHYLCFVFVVENRISQLPAPSTVSVTMIIIFYHSNGKVANTRQLTESSARKTKVVKTTISKQGSGNLITLRFHLAPVRMAKNK